MPCASRRRKVECASWKIPPFTSPFSFPLHSKIVYFYDAALKNVASIRTPMLIREISTHGNQPNAFQMGGDFDRTEINLIHLKWGSVWIVTFKRMLHLITFMLTLYEEFYDAAVKKGEEKKILLFNNGNDILIDKIQWRQFIEKRWSLWCDEWQGRYFDTMVSRINADLPKPQTREMWSCTLNISNHSTTEKTGRIPDSDFIIQSSLYQEWFVWRNRGLFYRRFKNVAFSTQFYYNFHNFMRINDLQT